MKKGKKSIVTVILTLILAIAGGVVYDNGNEAPQAPAQETVILQESQSTQESFETEEEPAAVLDAEAEQQEEPSEVAQPEVIVESEEEIEFVDSEEINFAAQEEELTFRKKSNLTSHYEKHGIEMGFASAEEYLEAANAVVNNPDSLHKLEAEDGDDVYYLEATNEFVVVSKDGYIRTYFNPSGGLDYFNRQ